MDKETLSNYGWIVICVLVLAVMIALAGPFGTFVAGAVKSTTAGLFGVNQNALDAAGITIGDQVFENCEHLETEIRNATADYSGDTCCKECGTVLGTGTYTIPTGGKYTKVDGTVLNAGQPFPTETVPGDIYKYGYYEYCYGYYYCHGNWSHKCPYGHGYTCDGWAVKCSNTANPGNMMESINGYPIVSLSATYSGCSLLTFTPTIPSTVTNMDSTFYNCSSLVTAPVIPSGVETLRGTFGNCTSLTGTIEINCNSITNIVDGKDNTGYYCFNNVDMSKITFTGSASKDVLNLIGSTGKNWTPLS